MSNFIYKYLKLSIKIYRRVHIQTQSFEHVFFIITLLWYFMCHSCFHRYLIVAFRNTSVGSSLRESQVMIIFILINSHVCNIPNAGHVTHIYSLLVIQTRRFWSLVEHRETILIGRFFSRDVIPLSSFSKKKREPSGTKRRKRQFSSHA